MADEAFVQAATRHRGMTIGTLAGCSASGMGGAWLAPRD